MSATIATKKKNVSVEFLKKTAGYIVGASGEYISEAMPTTTSTIAGAKETLGELQSTFSSGSSGVLEKVRSMKNQATFRNLSRWYLQKEMEFDEDFGDFDSSFDFDTDTDTTATIAEATISEWGKNANQISKTVVESSHKMVEAQLSATANLLSSVDKQTAVISSGFDTTNKTLAKILEVLTKNTSTLIEVTTAQSEMSSNDKSIRGKFNFSEYKKMVGENLKNSDAGIMMAMAPMILQMGSMMGPQDIIKIGLEAGLKKTAPNLKKNMEALDKEIGNIIMGSLIRLGEHKGEWGNRGMLARIFGIDSTRSATSTSKSSLEAKAVPFDSITKEAITAAIPGYLRQILVALGGPDTTYDYRSRSFKSKQAIKRDYQDRVAGTYISLTLDR